MARKRGEPSRSVDVEATPATVAEVDIRPPRRSSVGWLAAVCLLAVVGAAWWGSGTLVRRAQSSRLPAVDLSMLPPAARAQVEEAQQAAREAPRSAEAVGALGVAYHASLMTAEARAAYAEAEAIDPSAWMWTYYRGILHEERGEQEAALDAFRRVAIANPSLGTAWFRMGELLFKDGRLEEAAEAYTRAAEAAPQSPYQPPGVATREVVELAAYARLGLARVALDRRDVDSARRAIQAVLDAHPGFGPAWNLRAQLAVQTGEDAAAAPPTAGAYVPPPDPLLDRVVASSRMRDLLLKHAAVAGRGGDQAWREFLVRRALDANPADPNVLMETAMMLLDSGRATEALDYLRRREQLIPGDTLTLVELGRCLSIIGRLDEAEAVLRQAVRVRDAAAEYNLGAVLDRTGRGDEARARYEQALAIDPFHARAMINLGVWHDRRGQLDVAIGLLQRAVRVAPDLADAHLNLGSALIAARRLPDALAALRTAVALAPQSPEAHNNLGIALAQSGRMAEAVRAWETALTINPAHLNARRNLERARGR